jgi:hypothetical protein
MISTLHLRVHIFLPIYQDLAPSLWDNLLLPGWPKLEAELLIIWLCFCSDMHRDCLSLWKFWVISRMVSLGRDELLQGLRGGWSRWGQEGVPRSLVGHEHLVGLRWLDSSLLAKVSRLGFLMIYSFLLLTYVCAVLVSVSSRWKVVKRGLAVERLLGFRGVSSFNGLGFGAERFKIWDGLKDGWIRLVEAFDALLSFVLNFLWWIWLEEALLMLRIGPRMTAALRLKELLKPWHFLVSYRIYCLRFLSLGVDHLGITPVCVRARSAVPTASDLLNILLLILGLFVCLRALGRFLQDTSFDKV